MYVYFNYYYRQILFLKLVVNFKFSNEILDFLVYQHLASNNLQKN